MTDLTRVEQIIAKALLQPCDNHKDRAELARETARQVVEAAPAGVTLKPLEWGGYDENSGSAASTYFGQYYVEPKPTLDKFKLTHPDGEVSYHETDYDAKNFAQLDYRSQYSRTGEQDSLSFDEGVKEGLRRAAGLATSFLVGDPANGVPLRNPMAHEVAAAILALLTKEEGR